MSSQPEVEASGAAELRERMGLRLLLARWTVAGARRELERVGLDDGTTIETLTQLDGALRAVEQDVSDWAWRHGEHCLDLAYATLDAALGQTSLDQGEELLSFIEFAAALFTTAWEEWVADREAAERARRSARRPGPVVAAPLGWNRVPAERRLDALLAALRGRAWVNEERQPSAAAA